MPGNPGVAPPHSTEWLGANETNYVQSDVEYFASCHAAIRATRPPAPGPRQPIFAGLETGVTLNNSGAMAIHSALDISIVGGLRYSIHTIIGLNCDQSLVDCSRCRLQDAHGT